MKNGSVVLVAVATILVLTVVFGFGWVGIPWQWPPPSSPPGDLPEVTFKTDVVLEEPAWSLQPSITSIQATQVGSVTSSTTAGGLLALPWEGTLKLKIAYPQGQVVTYSQSVKVEWWSSKTVTFYWKTRQLGTHTITAELYNGDGKLIDTKSITVNRGG